MKRVLSLTLLSVAGFIINAVRKYERVLKDAEYEKE